MQIYWDHLNCDVGVLNCFTKCFLSLLSFRWLDLEEPCVSSIEIPILGKHWLGIELPSTWQLTRDFS